MFKPQPFLKQPVVLIGGLFLGAILLLTLSISVSSYNFTWEFCNSVACMEAFILHFKHPIWVVSGLISFLVLMNLLYRTNISEKTLISSMAQNTFSNYFEHRKQFIEYINDHPDLSKHIRDKKRTHQIYYPYASHGDFNFNKNILATVQENAQKLRLHLDKTRFSSNNNTEIANAIHDICKALNIRELSPTLLFANQAKPCALDEIRAATSNDEFALLMLPDVKHFGANIITTGYLNAYIREIFLFYPQGIPKDLLEHPLGINFRELEKQETSWHFEEYEAELEKRRNTPRKKLNDNNMPATKEPLSKITLTRKYKYKRLAKKLLPKVD